ncbi:hypothetical protein [Azotobacter armeniacus]
MLSKLLIGLLGPVVKVLVGKVLDELSDWLFERIGEVLRRRRAENLDKAEARAAQADERVRQASTPDEAREQETVARVWREVAEMLREENEALRAELEVVRRSADRQAQQAVAALPLDQVVEPGGEALKSDKGGRLLRLDRPSANR